MKQCPVCRMMLPEDSEFCQYCGTSIITATDGIESEIVPDITPNALNESKPKELSGDSVEGCESISPKIVRDDVEASIENHTKNPKQKTNWTALIALAVLLFALIILNIVQYSSNSKLSAQISTFENQLAYYKNQPALEDKEIEIASLKEQNETLNTAVRNQETQITNLKNDKAGLDTKVSELNAKITGLNNQISGLNNRITNLSQASEKAKYARSAYDQLKKFDYGSFDANYYSDTEVVVVKEGQTKVFFITSYLNTTIYSKPSNNCSESKWGDWNNRNCAFYVTGKKEGSTIYTFTNDANSTQFKVLVIVVPK